MFKTPIIHAFEPNPKLYMILMQKYQMNKNIFIYNKGVSDINGQLELNETITDETSTFEELNYDSNYLKLKANILGVNKEDLVKSKYLVEVVRLDDFIRNANINRIDILKIDVEGHELKCLRGLFSNDGCKISYIQLERHNDDMYLTGELQNEIPLLLKSNGFSKCSVVKHGFGDFDECIYEK
jgi:FkbM family methyltransferase